MARLTIFFGIVLILLGVLTYMGTGSKAPTSLIPVAFGVLLAIFGALARTLDMKKRMLWMHTAVAVGLLGFALTIGRGPASFIRMQMGTQFARPIAVYETTAMCVLLFAYVLFCVQWFVSRRRARIQGQA